VIAHPHRRNVCFHPQGFVKNYGARSLLWNFVLVGVLLITIAFARDLRGASGTSAILGDGYGVIP
jgi:hypothetical protein